MNKNVKLIVFSAIGLLIGYLGSQYLIDTFFKKPNIEEILIQVAEEMNKNCPITLDGDTRLDTTMGGPGKSFSYFYTLVNYSKEEINQDTLITYLKPNIINNVSTNPQMAIFRENEITMNYNYKDKEGVFLFVITVTPDNYKKNL